MKDLGITVEYMLTATGHVRTIRNRAADRPYQINQDQMDFLLSAIAVAKREHAAKEADHEEATIKVNDGLQFYALRDGRVAVVQISVLNPWRARGMAEDMLIMSKIGPDPENLGGGAP